MKHTLLYTMLLASFTFFLPIVSKAQGVVNDVPIDGGLSVLIAAGVGYGIKKVRDERKKTREAKKVMDK